MRDDCHKPSEEVMDRIAKALEPRRLSWSSTPRKDDRFMRRWIFRNKPSVWKPQ